MRGDTGAVTAQRQARVLVVDNYDSFVYNLVQYLGQLEADKADAVRGAYLDGFSYEELATRHEVPLNTMRTWLRRSLMKLRECLSA